MISNMENFDISTSSLDNSQSGDSKDNTDIDSSLKDRDEVTSEILSDISFTNISGISFPENDTDLELSGNSSQDIYSAIKVVETHYFDIESADDSLINNCENLDDSISFHQKITRFVDSNARSFSKFQTFFWTAIPIIISVENNDIKERFKKLVLEGSLILKSEHFVAYKTTIIHHNKECFAVKKKSMKSYFSAVLISPLSDIKEVLKDLIKRLPPKFDFLDLIDAVATQEIITTMEKHDMFRNDINVHESNSSSDERMEKHDMFRNDINVYESNSSSDPRVAEHDNSMIFDSSSVSAILDEAVDEDLIEGIIYYH
jgi:hypothetical protein